MKFYSWLVTALVLMMGTLFLYGGLADYGLSFFMIFPFAVGFSIATMNDLRKTGLVSLVVGLMMVLGILVVVGKEAIVCVLMALPVIVVLMMLGYWISKLIQRYLRARAESKASTLKIVLIPLGILLLSNTVERFFLPENAFLSVENSITLPYTGEVIFDGVKAMDKLDADKPILLSIGLPTPYRCILEGTGVGAKRTCLFNNGTIESEITAYEPGKILQMEVTKFALTGREWFRFKDAVYTFIPKDDSTTLIRTTSYESRLRPRFYWEPLEKYAIEQEHKFVLESLKKNLSEANPITLN
jgi:hypothetical protein